MNLVRIGLIFLYCFFNLMGEIFINNSDTNDLAPHNNNTHSCSNNNVKFHLSYFILFFIGDLESCGRCFQILYCHIIFFVTLHWNLLRGKGSIIENIVYLGHISDKEQLML
jgi:hypothetical protein